MKTITDSNLAKKILLRIISNEYKKTLSNFGSLEYTKALQWKDKWIKLTNRPFTKRIQRVVKTDGGMILMHIVKYYHYVIAHCRDNDIYGNYVLQWKNEKIISKLLFFLLVWIIYNYKKLLMSTLNWRKEHND